MLRKPPNARPTLRRCLNVLSELKTSQQDKKVTIYPSIDEAAKQVAEKEAKKEAERISIDTLRQERSELFEDAKNELLKIRTHFYSSIKDSSESVHIDNNGKLWFGEAEIKFKRTPEKLEEYHTSNNDQGRKLYQHTNWDVLGWSMISVTCHNSQVGSYTWSASLLFTDRKDGNGFRWYEVSFWNWSRSSRHDEPFALEGYNPDIDLALGNITHTISAAYGPSPIDGENEGDFISRWANLIAKAAIGKLNRPNNMPINDFLNN